MKLTYGFELEGAFHEELAHESGSYKFDGSVHNLSPNIPRHNENGNVYSEFESAVYKDPEKLLAAIEKFKDSDNFYWNDTCGLHLNVGTENRDEWKVLLGLVCDYKFLQSIRKEAVTWCDCMAHRLAKDNHFYQFQKSRSDLVREANSSEKYRFCRFHEEKRLEFRFLVPCRHKVKNVKRVLELLDKFLAKNHDLKMKIVARDTKFKDIVINVPITEERDIEYVHNLSS